jgi:hypothetical protein
VLRVSLKQQGEKNVDRIGGFGGKWSFFLRRRRRREGSFWATVVEGSF